jgi:protein involved in polysaccharide export with SLBB domain
MLLNKLRLVSFLAILGLTGAGASVALSRPAGRDEPPKPATPPVPKAPAAGNPEIGELRAVPLALLRQAPPKTYLLDSGDMLGIFVEGILGERAASPQPYPVTVEDDGTIALPLIEPINLRGRSIAEARQQISKAYVDGRLVAPGVRILISLVKPRTYRVTVVRDVAKETRMTELDLPAYQNDVLTALARSGGRPGGDSVVVVIQRGSAAPGTTFGAVAAGIQQTRIPLYFWTNKPLPFRPGDVILKAGDVISFEN